MNEVVMLVSDANKVGTHSFNVVGQIATFNSLSLSLTVNIFSSCSTTTFVSKNTFSSNYLY